MEVYRKIGRRLAVVALGIAVILAVRYGGALRHPSLRDGGEEWQRRAWENLYTSIHLTARSDSARLDPVLREIDTFLTRFTADYRNDGPFSRKIGEGKPGDTLELNLEETALLSFAEQLRNRSNGAIEPGIGRLLQLRKLTSGSVEGAFLPDSIARETERLREPFYTLDSANRRMVLHRGGVQIALGSFLKGWAIDRAAERLEAAGIVDYLFEAGGDLRCGGKSPRGEEWRLAVTDPRTPDGWVTTVLLGGELPCAMASSGGYAQYRIDSATGERHHHILDPRTGESARGLDGVTVVAPTATEADGMATWLMIEGVDRAKEILTDHPEAEGYLIPTGEEAWGTPLFLRNSGR